MPAEQDESGGQRLDHLAAAGDLGGGPEVPLKPIARM
jgi:hypothetical protein